MKWAARCLLIPSLAEGFGLPALEAMACGTPVIAAQAGALPEIVGSAAILVDPMDGRAWLDACARIHAEPELRQALSAHGLERAARFTWHACAQKTLAVYRRALDGGSPPPR